MLLRSYVGVGGRIFGIVCGLTNGMRCVSVVVVFVAAVRKFGPRVVHTAIAFLEDAKLVVAERQAEATTKIFGIRRGGGSGGSGGVTDPQRDGGAFTTTTTSAVAAVASGGNRHRQRCFE